MLVLYPQPTSAAERTLAAVGRQLNNDRYLIDIKMGRIVINPRAYD
jgi:hypothetical protein